MQCMQPYRALSLPEGICFSDLGIYNCEKRILYKGVISKSFYRIFNSDIHKKESQASGNHRFFYKVNKLVVKGQLSTGPTPFSLQTRGSRGCSTNRLVIN